VKPAIGLVEFNSIAQGILAGDAMVKRAEVDLLEARTICPGKYMVLIGGDTGPVGESMESGIEVGADTVVDQLFLPNVHISVFPAIAGAVETDEVEALGIIETISVASTIVAADAAAKTADVTLVELRLANAWEANPSCSSSATFRTWKLPSRPVSICSKMRVCSFAR